MPDHFAPGDLERTGYLHDLGARSREDGAELTLDEWRDLEIVRLGDLISGLGEHLRRIEGKLDRVVPDPDSVPF